MPVERRLKNLIIERYGTMKDFTPHTGLSYSTVDTILRRGVKNASVTNVIAICRALNISADELANGRIVPVEKKDFGSQRKADVNEMIDFVKLNIDSYDYLTLDGKTMTQDELEMLIDGISFSIEQIRKNRKRIDNK